MNILLFEDRGSVFKPLKDALETMGHKILDAYNIYEANEYLDQGHIDCIILDLNMSPDGLSDEEKKQTEDGILTGWIWLKNYALPTVPMLRQCTIIISEYIAYLQVHMKKEDLEGIELINKKSEDGLAKRLFGAIKVIEDHRQKRVM